MKHFEVLKIVFRMKTPPILAHPWLHFDGLIAHVALRRELGEKYYLLPERFPLQEIVDRLDLPIRRIYYIISNSTRYIYDCSVSIINGQFYPYRHMAVTFVRKRFTEKYIHEVHCRKNKIEIARGPYKLYDIKFLYVPCREIVFYVNAVESELIELLKHVHALGKKRSEGFGFIKEWTYEKTELETAIVLEDDTVTRPIPAPLVNFEETVERHGKCDLVSVAVRPPYWSPQNIELATIPGQRYVLKNNTNN